MNTAHKQVWGFFFWKLMLLSRLNEWDRDSTGRRTPPIPTSTNSPPCQPGLTLPNLILCCPLQAGICMCEEGFTEVLSPTGQLDQCAPIPILEIPTAGDKKGDVKTSRAINPTLPTTILPGRTGRTWYLQPYGPGQTTWHGYLAQIRVQTAASLHNTH